MKVNEGHAELRHGRIASWTNCVVDELRRGRIASWTNCVVDELRRGRVVEWADKGRSTKKHKTAIIELVK
jgi:hypothetical protein